METGTSQPDILIFENDARQVWRLFAAPVGENVADLDRDALRPATEADLSAVGFVPAIGANPGDAQATTELVFIIRDSMMRLSLRGDQDPVRELFIAIWANWLPEVRAELIAELSHNLCGLNYPEAFPEVEFSGLAGRLRGIIAGEVAPGVVDLRARMREEHNV